LANTGDSDSASTPARVSTPTHFANNGVEDWIAPSNMRPYIQQIFSVIDF